MTTNNAITTGVADQFKVVADDLRRTLDGLEGDSLNWRPVGDESSSIYMLVTHMMGMANGMSTIAAGKTPNRDRAAEFAAAGTSVEPLLKLIDDAQQGVQQSLNEIAPEMLGEPRAFMGGESTAGGLLVMMLRHLGEHLGHVTLTRQLWEQLETASN